MTLKLVLNGFSMLITELFLSRSLYYLFFSSSYLDLQMKTVIVFNQLPKTNTEKRLTDYHSIKIACDILVWLLERGAVHDVF